MDYRIEVIDTRGVRVASYREVPLLEAVRTTPDGQDRIRGLVPATIAALGVGFRVRVLVAGALFCEAVVTRVLPEWSDIRKLILDRYVTFQEVVAFEAETPVRAGNTRTYGAFRDARIDTMVRAMINRALGPIHYTVAHGAYPDGAVREWAKFSARRSGANELGVGGIDTGQWVGTPRLDASAAYAKDGDTIAGLVVDGVPWPDLRLMLIDADETTRNSRAIARHPEVAEWDEARYARSGYKRRADAATAALQALIDTHGIGHIELNPHRDATGAFDDRVDAFGRYLGWAYGGGQCFNAAMVELGLADVFLWQDGRYHDPAMALKEYYSYRGPASDSIAPAPARLRAFDTEAGVLEAVAALAYAAGGYTFSVAPDGAVHFGPVGTAAARVIPFDPVRVGVQLGTEGEHLANALIVEGHPVTGQVRATYTDGPSIQRHGWQARRLALFSLSFVEDAERLARGLLDDLAHPAPVGAVTFLHGDAAVAIGAVLEVRGAALRALDPPLPEAWGGRLEGRLVGRVTEVVHRFQGEAVRTTAVLGSPLRSVANPLAFLVRSQPDPADLYLFRLDNEGVGLDAGFRLG